MIVAGSTNPLLMGVSTGYNLTRSLRFRKSASAYLNRTPASAGNRQKFTISTWLKRGELDSGSGYHIFSSGPNTSSDRSTFEFSSNQLYAEFNVSGTWYTLTTNAIYRDPSAWYHIVIAVDTTQATDTNRVKIYVNGSQITSLATATYPPQNASTSFNNTVAHGVGYYSASGAGYFDGYMSEFNWIDGQQLTPSSFGETNSKTGVWQPKKYTGTYGTNGFYLPFTDNSALTSGSNAGLGKDFSGNGNYWNTNNISITSGATYDSMTDVPTLTSATAANFCTLNPLNSTSSAGVVNANLQFTSTGSTWNTATGTMGVSSGKYYWEVTVGSLGTLGALIGIESSSVNYAGTTNSISASATGYSYYSNGQKYNNNTGASYGASFTTGDVIGVALDLDGGTITFYKNNSSQGTAYSSLSGNFVPALSIYGTPYGFTPNFGQRPFAYTPPTGYVALNTYNLPTPTIGATASSQANKYFDISLSTGNGTSQTITNSGSFQPDFVWQKDRSVARSHLLFDAIRGVYNGLYTNSTAAEATDTTSLTAFTSNGFTVGSNNGNNANGETYVAWQWKANGSGSSNTAGSITSTVSVNTTSGFSIVTYSGTGSAATVGHGLGVAPKMIIVKRRNTAQSWPVYHASLGATKNLYLDLTDAAATATAPWNDTSPTSTVFTVGTSAATNSGSGTYVAYCFAEINGFSKFGSYTGNGSTDGPFIYTGFRPRYIFIKRTDSTSSWRILDTARSPYNAADLTLYTNLSDAEINGDGAVDLDSNGFKIRNAYTSHNASGGTYIYAAFAETPFKYSLAR